MSNEQIPFSGGVVELRGSSSQTLTLDNNEPVLVKWEPLDRIALDVEVRASIQQYNGLDDRYNTPPAWIRYQSHVGHGRSIWIEPPDLPVRANFGGSVEPKQILWPVMPARGLCLRQTSRELSIAFRNSGFYGREYLDRDLAGGAKTVLTEGGFSVPTFPIVTLTVSIQPVYGLDTALSYRYAHWTPSDWGKVIAFPAGAREWRLFDLQGQSLPEHYPGEFDDPEAWGHFDSFPTRIDYVDQLGGSVHTTGLIPAPHIDEDWHAIPLHAWGFMVNTDGSADDAEPFTAEFR